MLTTGLLCTHCSDLSDLVTPLNGSTVLARMASGHAVVTLHNRCQTSWADKNGCDAMAPMRRVKSRGLVQPLSHPRYSVPSNRDLAHAK
jgi:hypothetical protein